MLGLALGVLARLLLVLGAAGDRDLRALLDLHPVLREEFGGHREALRGAEAPERGQRAVGALRERQFEARERLIGDRLERRRRYAGFIDERRTDEIDRDAIALQH